MARTALRRFSIVSIDMYTSAELLVIGVAIVACMAWLGGG